MNEALERLSIGQEATVRYPGPFPGTRDRKWRGVFLGIREQDGSLEFWTETPGFRNAPPDADIVVHRKRTLPIPRRLRDKIDPETGKLRKQ